MSRPLNTKLDVYLVEDSAQVRDRLIESVTEYGLGRVVGYADTEDGAVSEILRLNPDVVLLDIQLRVGNGLNVMRKLRASPPQPMPDVIVFTDYAIADFGRFAIRLGARYFLDKASGLNHLGSLLRSLGTRPQSSA